uniref:Uncharacterized protein n=1 Tax=Anguilla anguilla TaxID=7936 RepID=A0A0E9R986_ANGAN
MFPNNVLSDSLTSEAQQSAYEFRKRS